MSYILIDNPAYLGIKYALLVYRVAQMVNLASRKSFHQVFVLKGLTAITRHRFCLLQVLSASNGKRVWIGEKLEGEITAIRQDESDAIIVTVAKDRCQPQSIPSLFSAVFV